MPPRLVLLTVILTAIAAPAAPVPGATESSAEIGVIIPLSGDLALFGEKLRQGIELAAERFPGRVKLHFEDMQNSNAAAASAFRKLVETRRVRAVIGPFGPGPTLTLAPMAKASGVLLMAVSLCEERFIPLENVFCVYPSVRDQIAPLLALFAQPARRPKSMALLFEQAEVTEFFQKALREYAAQHGIELLLVETFAAGEHDFRGYLARLKRRTPELLALGGWPPSALQLLRQAREMSLTPGTLWYFSEIDADSIRTHAALFEGVYFAAVPHEPREEFRHLMQRRFGRKPDLYHSAGHDAALCLLQAMLESPGADAPALAEILVRSPCRGTANPEFRFDRNRAVKLTLEVKTASGGVLLPVE